jgi:hypothetical protein
MTANQKALWKTREQKMCVNKSTNTDGMPGESFSILQVHCGYHIINRTCLQHPYLGSPDTLNQVTQVSK